MRRLAITLAAAVAIVQIVVIGAAEVRLGQALRDVGGPDTWGLISRVIGSGVWTLPWIAGAVLLWRRRLGMGVAILVAAALLTVPSAPFVFQWIFEVVDGVPVDSALLWVELVAGTVAWLLAVLVGLAAWGVRPRTIWRTSAPGLGNVYVVVAFLAWLPSILTSTEFVIGELGTELGARSFYEFIWTNSGGVGAGVGIAEALVLGGLLAVSPLLRRDAAGALLLAIMIPSLVVEIQTIIEVLDEDFLISTPASIAGAVGMLGVSVIAIRWIAQSRAMSAELPPSSARTSQDVDGAAG